MLVGVSIIARRPHSARGLTNTLALFLRGVFTSAEYGRAATVSFAPTSRVCYVSAPAPALPLRVTQTAPVRRSGLLARRSPASPHLRSGGLTYRHRMSTRAHRYYFQGL